MTQFYPLFILLFYPRTVGDNTVWFVINGKTNCSRDLLYSSQFPDFVCIDIPRERSLWIMITIFSVFIVLILTWTLNVKRNRCVWAWSISVFHIYSFFTFAFCFLIYFKIILLVLFYIIFYHHCQIYNSCLLCDWNPICSDQLYT